MASFNRIILMGNLTRDPQLKYLPNNTAVCEFGLAINHRWRDREGNQREEVCFVDCACFGRGGEVINQYMTKGRSLLVEGRLKLDSWTGQDGQKRSKHSVVVDNFTFVGGRPDQPGTSGSRAPAEGGATNWNSARGPAPADAGVDEGPPPTGENIPF